LLNERRFKKALEIGCSEGLFTHQLAAICEEVIGLDISQTAIQRARTAYPDLAHVKFSKNDVVDDPIPPGNDLVVCGEVLNLIASKDQLATVRGKIVRALNPGGWLMIVNLNLMPDDRKGFGLRDISFSSSSVRKFFQSDTQLRTIHEFETEMYRATVFEKTRT
jgi:predicted TPR repeat methyltransferase